MIDNRDNKTYAIAKLKDGNVWMAENLDFGRTALITNLTSANTNLTTTVTSSTFNSWIKTSGTSSYTSAELIPVTGTDSTSGTPYGTLYNYCAVSAGTICTDSNDNNATSDICPAGWRLPTGGDSGEFQTLHSLTDYNTNAKMRAPISSGGAAFSLAGTFTSSTPGGQGEGSFYWSSTRSSSTSMYDISLSASSVYPGGDSRFRGYAVRCLASL